MQAVDGAHVAGVQDQGAVAARAREEGPPLGAHDASDLHVICRHEWRARGGAGGVKAACEQPPLHGAGPG